MFALLLLSTGVNGSYPYRRPDPKFTEKLKRMNAKKKNHPEKVKELVRRYPEEWNELRELVREWKTRGKTKKCGATHKKERRERLISLFLDEK